MVWHVQRMTRVIVWNLVGLGLLVAGWSLIAFRLWLPFHRPTWAWAAVLACWQAAQAGELAAVPRMLDQLAGRFSLPLLAAGSLLIFAPFGTPDGGAAGCRKWKWLALGLLVFLVQIVILGLLWILAGLPVWLSEVR